jgi:uncharacterized protein (DUF2141 family)
MRSAALRRMLLLAAAAIATPASADDLRILVLGIGSEQGEIRCLLFRGSEGFPLDAERAIKTASYPAVMPMLTCTFADVEPGRYAVSVVHDENGNGEMDSNFVGSSKEPWGVSNNVRAGKRAPKFMDALIRVEPPHAADFEITLQR